MKKIMLAFVMLISIFACSGCSQVNQEVIRIHIRANSNNVEDQSIKLIVRDNIIEYITPLISDCNSSFEVKNVLQNNTENLKSIAENTLRENGFEYGANAKITCEYFPTRSYDGKVFDAGNYQALIINLGSGSGNNWWCVAYPPMCFVGVDNGTENIEYRSKILELINKFFGK